MVTNRTAAGASRSRRRRAISADGGFPASYAGPERQVLDSPPPGKPPLFIMLDGTWPEARKMFRKSPWLDALPMISVDLSRISAYHLREAHAEGQYCTAEVAIALLDLAGDKSAATALGGHFSLFKTALPGRKNSA